MKLILAAFLAVAFASTTVHAGDKPPAGDKAEKKDKKEKGKDEKKDEKAGGGW